MTSTLPASLDEPAVIAADASMLVVWKPAKLHTAPLAEGGPDLATWVFARFPDAAPLSPAFSDRDLPPGRKAGEAGLVHRLDFETAGLVIFARSAASLRSLLLAQEAGAILKTYLLEAAPGPAFLEGSRPLRFHPSGLEQDAWDDALAADSLQGLAGLLAGSAIEGRFRSFGPGAARVACLDRASSPSAALARKGAVASTYRTELVFAEALPDGLRAEVRLARGFRHQVRAHFAWIGLPLHGDGLYGGRAQERLQLTASALELDHPGTGERLVIDLGRRLVP